MKTFTCFMMVVVLSFVLVFAGGEPVVAKEKIVIWIGILFLCWNIRPYLLSAEGVVSPT